VQANVRITDLDLVHTTAEKNRALVEAIRACQENHVWQWDYMRVYTVSVNDPNPAKVHAVLAACADIGIVLG